MSCAPAALLNMVESVKNGITRGTVVEAALVVVLLGAVYFYAEQATKLRSDLSHVIGALEKHESLLLENKTMIGSLDRRTVGRTNEGFHKQDLYNLCVALERKNPGWTCADPYAEIPQRYPR